MFDKEDGKIKTTKRVEEVYSIFRAYVEHENNLINHRTTWLITVQSFLIAAFAFSYQVELTEIAKILSAPQTHLPLLKITIGLYNFFLLGLAIIGLGTSWVELVSVKAAVHAIQSLEEKWHKFRDCEWRAMFDEPRLLFDHLPEITGGCDNTASRAGTGLTRRLPKFFRIFWICGIIFVLINSGFDCYALAQVAAKN